MAAVAQLIQDHRSYFDVMHAASVVLALIGWSTAFVLLCGAWLRGRTIAFSAFGWQMFELQRATVSATAATRAFLARRPKGSGLGASPSRQIDVAGIQSILAKAFKKSGSSRLFGKSVLWVDDQPANNTAEVQTLESLGLFVEQVTSTQEALAKLATFDLVISDMGRPEDDRAGYKLLAEVREQGSNVPFVIYSSSSKPEHRREARAKGATAATNDPRELFAIVIDTLSSG
jgi:CheY-like chemotaxis protein